MYKLSELTLGSLLAAYSLGFIGLIAARLPEKGNLGRLGLILLSLQYASISVSFVFLTVSFYLTFHAGILTIPQRPLYRARIDFSLAILQALFFGISMLFPWCFPLLMGLNLFLVGLRQEHEYWAFAKVLYKQFCAPDIDPKKFKMFRHKLKKHLRLQSFAELSGWGPTGGGIWIACGTLVAVGLIVRIFGGRLLPISLSLSSTFGLDLSAYQTAIEGKFSSVLIACELVCIMIGTMIVGWHVLTKRAQFLVNPIKIVSADDAKAGGAQDRDMDEQFQELQKDLRQPCLEQVLPSDPASDESSPQTPAQ